MVKSIKSASPTATLVWLDLAWLAPLLVPTSLLGHQDSTTTTIDETNPKNNNK